jgi:hypothetical protein
MTSKGSKGRDIHGWEGPAPPEQSLTARFPAKDWARVEKLRAIKRMTQAELVRWAIERTLIEYGL